MFCLESVAHFGLWPTKTLQVLEKVYIELKLIIRKIRYSEGYI